MSNNSSTTVPLPPIISSGGSHQQQLQPADLLQNMQPSFISIGSPSNASITSTSSPPPLSQHHQSLSPRNQQHHNTNNRSVIFEEGQEQHATINSNKSNVNPLQQSAAPVFSASSPSSSPSAPSPPSSAAFHSATYGDMFGATLHFWLESIVARCRCDRVSLFLPHPKHHTLVRVAMVGPTAQPVSTQNSQTALFSQRHGDTPGSAGPVTAAVLQTGVAANLSAVAQEDAADCPGTTVAKTALVVPIKPLKHTTSTGANAAVGVLFAVNKLGGSQVFSTHDQYVLISIAPSIAYMAETYPVDFAAHRFDPSPLHRIIAQFKNSNKQKRDHQNHQQQHPVWGANNSTIHGKSGRRGASQNHNHKHQHSNHSSTQDGELKTDEDESVQANLVLPERPPQLVYEQSGAEAMIPYVALALEEKSKINHEKPGTSNKNNNNDSASSTTLKKKNLQTSSSSTNHPSMLLHSITSTNNSTTTTFPPPETPATTPEAERDRIFNQSNPTWEEVSREQEQILRQQHNVASDGINSLSTAQQIVSVGEFVNRMEQCWRDAVSRTIATERELTLRNAQVVDAHSILHRKQRRLEILKDVLVETLEKSV